VKIFSDLVQIIFFFYKFFFISLIHDKNKKILNPSFLSYEFIIIIISNIIILIKYIK